MITMPTDTYVFEDSETRAERFRRYDEIFMDEPLDILCRAARRHDEEFKQEMRELLNDKWMRPLNFERDAEILKDVRYDFVFDRKTGLIFRGLASQHGATMDILFRIHTGQMDADNKPGCGNAWGMDRFSEQYLEQGMGAFMSSMDSQRGRKRLRCCERFESTMTPQEIEAFEAFEIVKQF